MLPIKSFDEISRSDFFNPFFFNWQPIKMEEQVELAEEDKQYIASIELPGYKKSDVNLEIKNGNVQISATRNLEYDDSDKLHRKERGSLSKSFTFTLPESVQSDKVDAKMEDGILKIYLPKNEKAENQTKLITIN